MYFVGVDAHKRSSYLTVIDASGSVLRRARVPSDRGGLGSVLGAYAEPLSAVLEAGYSWGPVYDMLDELCEEVVLAHPRKVRLIAESRIKTDRLDSEILAQLLRADLIPAAHASSRAERSRKRLLRRRLFCVRLQTMVKNRIQALLAQQPLQPPALGDLFGAAGMAWLRGLELAGPDGHILAGDLELLVSSSDGLIASLSAGDEAVAWLRSLPGVGRFFSVLIRWEVGSIGRFASAKKLAAYAGLAPSTYASGEVLRHGRLSKAGNRWLRWAFVEAVTGAVRSSRWLRSYYEGIKARRGAKDARIATARKLLALAWAVWTQRRSYEER